MSAIFFSCSIDSAMAEKYSPEVDVKIFPKLPSPQTSIEVNAAIFDKFGKILDATLFYSVDNGTSWNYTDMNLVWGDFSNGTFLGIIPPQKEFTPIQYKIFLKDNLNYTSTYADKYYTFSDDKNGPVIDYSSIADTYYLVPGRDPVVTIRAADESTGVKNVTLNYRDNYQAEFNSVTMKLTSGNKWNGTYEAPLHISDKGLSGTDVRYFIDSYDNAENYYNGSLRLIPAGEAGERLRYGDGPGPLEGYFYVDGKWNRAFVNNEVDIMDTAITQVDPETQSVDIEFSCLHGLFNKTVDVSSSYLVVTNIIADDQEVPKYNDPTPNVVFLNNTDQGGTFRQCNVLENPPIESDISEFLDTNVNMDQLLLSGYPNLYPFDQYYTNLIVLPSEDIESNTLNVSKNIKIDHIGEVTSERLLNPNLDTSSLKLSENNIIKPQLLPSNFHQENLNSSFINIYGEFKRNYTILQIIIPLLAIFFLLGAIFIFENSSDNIGNRLTLTLGIFALIFTLPEVIDSMKPQTSGPTIADTMFSIIIIATIAFTISSVISSSSIIRNWFPRHHSWIDGIVFLIVAGIVIAYFSTYPIYITLWLVPIIVFGLGYGLLLRTLGIKITKPLKTWFVRQDLKKE
jgi:hypothetical protein